MSARAIAIALVIVSALVMSAVSLAIGNSRTQAARLPSPRDSHGRRRPRPPGY